MYFCSSLVLLVKKKQDFGLVCADTVLRQIIIAVQTFAIGHVEQVICVRGLIVQCKLLNKIVLCYALNARYIRECVMYFSC